MAPESGDLISHCASVTGLTRSEVISIARTGPKRYKIYQIDKRSGGKRTICHPSRELKALQYFFFASGVTRITSASQRDCLQGWSVDSRQRAASHKFAGDIEARFSRIFQFD